MRSKGPFPKGARPTTRGKLVTNGFVWGRRRVELGLSLTDLSRQTGINVGMLSFYENGRMIPTADDFDAVFNVLAVKQAATPT